MRRLKVAAENFYHVYNRGVDKREIFLDENDKERFILDLARFNNAKPVRNLFHEISSTPYCLFSRSSICKSEDPLVDILAFVLMPNHFHLLLQPKGDQCITDFMRKIGCGYANYFNDKYKRTGTLFEGKYKIVHVSNHAHLLHLPYYIHANPLKLKFPNWREKGLADKSEEALRFLEGYQWSSFLDYEGMVNFPLVTERGFLFDLYSDGKTEKNKSSDYKKNFKKWLYEHDDLSSEVSELNTKLK